MRAFLIFLLATSYLLPLTAQEIPVQLRIAPGVSPDVQQRLLPALQRRGALLDSLSGVLLTAELVPMREGTIEGMRTKMVVAYDLLVNLRLQGSERFIGGDIVSLRATGANTEEARRNALQQLTTKTALMDQLWETLRERYQAAFTEHCRDHLAVAAQQAERGNVLSALAIVDAIPLASTCYSAARTLRETYYLSYQEKACQGHLESARQQLALELPKAALEEIGKIDPASDCALEARQLLEAAAAKLKTQQSQKAQFLRQVYQNQVQVEQARNAIIADLVKE